MLEVRLNGGEPVQNVQRSLKDEGHRVTGIKKLEDGTYRMLVVKGGLSA